MKNSIYRWLSLVAGVGALGLAIACGSDDENSSDDDGSGGTHNHSQVHPSCQEIIDACHTVDDGSEGRINDCHAMAHANDMAFCDSDGDDCVAECEAAGGGGAAGSHNHSGGMAGMHNHTGGMAGHSAGGMAGHAQAN